MNADLTSIDSFLFSKKSMQSSTTDHYLSEQMADHHFFFQSEPMIDDDVEEEIEENFFPETVNRIETGLAVAGLQIKGKVRTLSPVLFYQTNTRYLIISNNQLKSLPAEIGNLINLVYLDLSYNRLKTLPSQIGDLIHLKRLYLESNSLKNLPYELGKLDIEDLSLKKNPLGDQILSLFARPNGTYEVMNYLREKWTIICSYKMSLPWSQTNETNSTN